MLDQPEETGVEIHSSCLAATSIASWAQTWAQTQFEENSLKGDFRTRPQAPPRTHDPSQCVMIRMLRDIGPTRGSRIEVDDYE